MNQRWNELLDELKVKEGFTSDAALARSLSISRAFISSLRHDRCSVPIALGREIFSRLGRTLTPQDETLFVAKQVARVTRTIEVNPVTRVQALLRANGRCQLCQQEAPFTLRDGSPYLEAHHIVPLGKGGKDDLSNLVALCPNCHRKLHFVPTEADLTVLSEAASLWPDSSSHS